MGGRGASGGYLPKGFDLDKTYKPGSFTEGMFKRILDHVPENTILSVVGTPMSYIERKGKWKGAFGEEIDTDFIAGIRNQGRGVGFENNYYSIKQEWRKKYKRN